MKKLFWISLGLVSILSLGCAKDRGSNHRSRKATPATNTANGDDKKNSSGNGNPSTRGTGANGGNNGGNNSSDGSRPSGNNSNGAGANEGGSANAGSGSSSGTNGSGNGDTGQSPEQNPAGNDETARTVDYVKVMADKQKQHPEELAKCIENAEKLNGSWKQWSFVIESWYLGDSSEKFTPEQMKEKGYSVTRELFPIQQEVSVQKEANQLVAKMLFSTAADAKKGSVVFAIYPEPETGDCIWAQSPTAGGRPLFDDSWVLVKAKPGTLWEHKAAVPFELHSSDGAYHATGYLKVFKE